ncbi:STAS domain-containing protein [Streptomyces sp. NPDC001717]|uniref:STAS domain-containing protein n=1 Tax=Streptomyces sp. NPDC001717 TaxID=3364604 RepID=UPI00367C8DFC
MTEPPVVELPGREDGTVVCRLRGEIDIEARSHLHAAFTDAAACATRAVVIDCSRLEFADSTLLNALLQLRRDAAARRLALIVAAPAPQLLRLLELTGTVDLLHTSPSLAQALAGLRPAPRAWCSSG